MKRKKEKKYLSGSKRMERKRKEKGEVEQVTAESVGRLIEF